MDYQYDRQDNYVVLTIKGDLIGEEKSHDIITELESYNNGRNINLLVDISEVRYINSSGLGILITLLTKVRNRGGELYLINPSESVKKLLIITKLETIFKVYHSASEALADIPA